MNNSPEIEQGSLTKRSRTSASPRKFKTRRQTSQDGVQARKVQLEESSQSEEEKEECSEKGADHSAQSTSSFYSKPKEQPFHSECKKSDDNRAQSEYRDPFNSPKVINKFLEKYRLDQKLQSGAYGEVFSGVRIEDNFPVALKVIRKNLMNFTNMKVNGRMTRIPVEVHMLTKVGAGPGSASPTVTPRLLDWYNLGLDIILVLEKPQPCVDLLNYITSQNPNGIIASKAKVIFRQLVQAAIELHAQGVFHRDIKPGNILIETGGDEPRARFIDFGCATTFTPGQCFEEPEDCRKILEGCLHIDPRKRLTLQQLRDHPWLKTE